MITLNKIRALSARESAWSERKGGKHSREDIRTASVKPSDICQYVLQKRCLQFNNTNPRIRWGSLVRGFGRVRETSTGYLVREGVLSSCPGRQQGMLESKAPEGVKVEQRKDGTKAKKGKRNVSNTSGSLNHDIR